MMAFTNSTVNNVVSKLLQCKSVCNPVHCWKWNLAPILYHRQPVNYAVVILNTPITQSQRFFKDFWNNASIRTTVDGGTNKWDAFVNSLSQESQKGIKWPDLVTGDFDSIAQDILEKCKSTGCKVIHTPDQNHTDFTKALIELNTHCQQSSTHVDHVIAIAQSSRRMDQIFGNVQTMFLAKENKLLSPNCNLYLISDDAISWLLFPGSHVINIPEESRKHARAWCSLVPVGEPCRSVTSSGLKWDLDKHTLKFGELVSTSNTFTESEVVKVTCSNTLLWSMKVPSLLSRHVKTQHCMYCKCYATEAAREQCCQLRGAITR